MATTIGIIEIPVAAQGTTQQPQVGNFAVRRIGGAPFLDWVIRRVTDSLLLDQVIVLFDQRQADSLRHLTPPDVAIFESPLEDPLGRFASACRHFDATAAVRVHLDCPFVDPEVIDRLVCNASTNSGFDYVGYCAQGGQPAIHSKLGVFTEWVRASAIERADREAKADVDRADVMQYIYARPEQFHLRLIPIPTALDRRDLRLTVSSDEDWDHAYAIFEALGPDHLDWQTIVGMLDQQPRLRRRMADLNQAESTAIGAN